MLGQQIEIIPVSIGQIFTSYASNNKNKLKETNKLFRVIIMLSFLSMLILSIIIEPIVFYGFGELYSDVSMLVLVMLPGLVVSSGGRILCLYLRIIKKPKYEARYTWYRVIFMLVFIPVGFETYGLLGTALAITLSRFIRLYLVVNKYLIISRSKISQLVPRIQDANILINFFKK